MELSNDDAGIPFRKMEISTEIYPAILWEDRGGMIHTQLFVGHIWNTLWLCQQFAIENGDL